VVAVVLALIIAAAPVQADRVLIRKSARQLTLLRNGKVLRAYHVSLGSNPAGCIAVSDAEIEEIWKLVPNGTVVEIRP
jgi:hypothetical protein